MLRVSGRYKGQMEDHEISLKALIGVIRNQTADQVRLLVSKIRIVMPNSLELFHCVLVKVECLV